MTGAIIVIIDGSSYYGDGLCANLGLEIEGTGSWQGQSFGESNSYNNAWEIVQFTAPYTGNYKANIFADSWTGWGEYIAAACYRWQPVREDFEWGSEGEPLSNDGNNVGWTVTEFGAGGTASAEIDDDHYHGETRCAEFYSDYNGWDITVGVRASYPEDCPEWRGFWAMTNGDDDITYTGWVTATGDGDKFLSVRVKPGGRLQYRQDSYWWHDTNPVFIISPDRWYFIELRNIDWYAATYDIYVDGDCVQDGVPMNSGTDWHGLTYEGITSYATSESWFAGGGSFWIDDIYYPRVGG